MQPISHLCFQYKKGMNINVSYVIVFLARQVLKSKVFVQLYSNEIAVFYILTQRQGLKKCQVNFLCQKSTEFFQKKKKLSKKINLGDHFLLKTFFLDSIFEPLYFLKLGPILCRPHSMSIHKIQQFHLTTVDF